VVCFLELSTGRTVIAAKIDRRRVASRARL